MTVDTECLERVDKVQRALGLGSRQEAVSEMVDILEAEGYVDGDGQATVASAGRVDELEKQMGRLTEAVTRLRDRVEELEDE